MAWSYRKKICTGCILGWLLALIGIVMIPVVDHVVAEMVKKETVLKEGNILYDTWRDLPIPIYMQFYMFDCVNIEEVLQGAKPFVKQKGPYTYLEKRIKYDIIHNSNGTVTYKQNRTFTFLPEMSIGPENDTINTANPVMWALITELKWQKPEIREAINLVLSLGVANVFFQKTVKEIIWGYHDPLLTLAGELAPEWFYTDFIGYFMNKNNTNDGVYTIFTGETDHSLTGKIDKYNGSSYLNFWTTPWANMINGSDGTISPPLSKQSTTQWAFSSDVCRSVGGNFVGKVTDSHGLTLWRYTGSYYELANYTVNPDNIGFCTPQENCLDAGILNMSTCQLVDFFHIPAALSFPHFYMASKRYQDSVEGLHPVKEEHQTTLDGEPYTGWVFQAAKRIQINMYIQPIENIESTSKITPVYLPVFWLNESAVVDEKNANLIKSMLYTPLKVVLALEIFFISVGGVFITVTISYMLYRRHKHKEEEELPEDEDDPQPRTSKENDPLIPSVQGT